MTQPPPTPKAIVTDAPTHRCKICNARWRKNGDETWTLMSRECGQCCDNAPMGGQMQMLEDYFRERELWRPAVEMFRKAVTRRGQYPDDLELATVKAIVAASPNPEASEIMREAWQPIEAAPVDQLVVFAYFGPNESWNGFAAVVKQFQWETMKKPLATGWPASIEATHWMPLPEPPALSSRGEWAG